jgi:hypothetical protein
VGVVSGMKDIGKVDDERPQATAPCLLSESLRILKERGSMVTRDSEFGRDLEEIIRSHNEPMNPPAWD